MNWAQKNPFLTGYLVVSALAAAGVGYFTFNAFTTYESATADYQSAVSKLQNLQNRVPFPSTENLESYAGLTSAYAKELNALMATLATKQTQVESFTPQGFQDHLRQIVSDISQRASENGVTLPDGFYLGFDEYKGTLPPESAIASLATQLDGIRTVVGGLIDLKVTAIASVTRTPVAEERPQPAATPRPAQPRPNDRNAKPETPKSDPVLIARPFDITFRADQTRVRQALNQIVTGDQFFIIRSVTVRNTQIEGPPRATAAASPTPAATDAAGASIDWGNVSGTVATTQPAPALNVIVGRELVDVSARIEMIGFNLPATKE